MARRRSKYLLVVTPPSSERKSWKAKRESAAVVRHVNDAWLDRLQRNFVPDCNLATSARTAVHRRRKHQLRPEQPAATRYSPEVLNGYGKRDFNRDFATELQHQLRPGVGFREATTATPAGTSGMRRRPAQQQAAGHRQPAVTPPTTTRSVSPHRRIQAANGGGYQVCGLADIKPEKFGQVVNLVKLADG
jgi:hypothetical protein